MCSLIKLTQKLSKPQKSNQQRTKRWVKKDGIEFRMSWNPFIYCLGHQSSPFQQISNIKYYSTLKNFRVKKMFCLKCQFDNEKPTKCLTHNDGDLLYSFEISISNVRWNESSTHSISAMQSCFLFRFPFFCCFLIIFILFSDRERERDDAKKSENETNWMNPT